MFSSSGFGVDGGCGYSGCDNGGCGDSCVTGGGDVCCNCKVDGS